MKNSQSLDVVWNGDAGFKSGRDCCQFVVENKFWTERA